MKRAIVLMTLLILATADVEAQCVMCKAVAEDSAEDGSLGRG